MSQKWIQLSRKALDLTQSLGIHWELWINLGTHSEHWNALRALERAQSLGTQTLGTWSLGTYLWPS